jgi:hypothetical protein
MAKSGGKQALAAAKGVTLTLSPEFAQVYREKERLLHNRQIASRVWTRVLTEVERANLGGELEECLKRYGGTVGMWLQVRRVWPRAVIAIA